MKTSLYTAIFALLLTTGITAATQAKPNDYLGLPGDNFNLYATLKLFQESETLESFERSLNDENSMINNLDLNGDRLVDYITVTDYVDGNLHTIVLRAALNRDETQDVAVFTVERFRNGEVQIQLIGDEALYGPNYIVEPIYADETPNPGYTGRTGNVVVTHVTTYQVASWPVIRFMYHPGYVSWRSSWHFGYYPNYWSPWRPFYWHTYYGYHQNYHHHYYGHYRHWDHYRCHRYHDVYYSRIRTYSPTVNIWINKGHYRTTYSRPDLRREGQVLYSRTHQNNQRVRSVESVRRSRNIPTQSEQARSTGSESGRRSYSSTDSRSSGSPAVYPGSGSSRRTTTSGTRERTVTTPPSTQKKATTAPASPRTYQKPSETRRTESTRKAPTVTNSRESSASQGGQNSSSGRRSATTVSGGSSSGKSQNPAGVSSGRSSSQPKAAPSVRSSSPKSEKSAEKSSRRETSSGNSRR